MVPRTSHGVGQYDLERASTWAMIGFGKPQSEVMEADKSEENSQEDRAGERLVSCPLATGGGEGKEIDYKKVTKRSQASLFQT